MSLPTKITVIGAGSASFGENTLSAIMRSKKLCGSTLALVDRNADSLDIVNRLANRLNREWDAQLWGEAAGGAASPSGCHRVCCRPLRAVLVWLRLRRSGFAIRVSSRALPALAGRQRYARGAVAGAAQR